MNEAVRPELNRQRSRRVIALEKATRPAHPVWSNLAAVPGGGIAKEPVLGEHVDPASRKERFCFAELLWRDSIFVRGPKVARKMAPLMLTRMAMLGKGRMRSYRCKSPSSSPGGALPRWPQGRCFYFGYGSAKNKNLRSGQGTQAG